MLITAIVLGLVVYFIANSPLVIKKLADTAIGNDAFPRTPLAETAILYEPLAGALLFSTVNALQLWVQVLGLNLPSDVAVMLPYILTILALALPIRRAAQPAALTKPFTRGES